MKYNDIIKILSDAGFVEGTNNVRKKNCCGYQLVAAISEIDIVKEIFLTIQLCNSSESFCSVVIPTNSYNEFERALNVLSTRFNTEIMKFSKSIKELLDDLQKSKLIKIWK